MKTSRYQCCARARASAGGRGRRCGRPHDGGREAAGPHRRAGAGDARACGRVSQPGRDVRGAQDALRQRGVPGRPDCGGPRLHRPALRDRLRALRLDRERAHLRGRVGRHLERRLQLRAGGVLRPHRVLRPHHALRHERELPRRRRRATATPTGIEIQLSEATDITFCCTAEFPLHIVLIDGTAGCAVRRSSWTTARSTPARRPAFSRRSVQAPSGSGWARASSPACPAVRSTS